ncbi:hypothetical protein FN846DRAFT_914625 [Sphaerosporella brunnea]|uniref:Uncharacterized protein n=1 Tax=Sphaerosporella brunnea TaxID=1250544 RepID=A0A5J5ECP0_9PEZI|nr:hypothetical protein FN846DRAFT_914625 [Sphaerosporella brunnea]
MDPNHSANHDQNAGENGIFRIPQEEGPSIDAKNYADDGQQELGHALAQSQERPDKRLCLLYRLPAEMHLSIACYQLPSDSAAMALALVCGDSSSERLLPWYLPPTVAQRQQLVTQAYITRLRVGLVLGLLDAVALHPVMLYGVRPTDERDTRYRLVASLVFKSDSQAFHIGMLNVAAANRYLQV